MADKVCVKLWATKLLSEFTRYFDVATMGLRQRLEDLTQQIEGMLVHKTYVYMQIVLNSTSMVYEINQNHSPAFGSLKKLDSAYNI